jgi:Arc/MetJ-type ribon-helix-helix transcriptional regulator
MTIHLPTDLESSVRAQVLSGNFASEDELVVAAVREYLRQHQDTPQHGSMESSRDPLLGLMSDHAELMDQIVEDAMQQREQPSASSPQPAKRKPLWQRAAELRQSIPAEEWDKVPTDGARQLDHYIYGSPKRTDA